MTPEEFSRSFREDYPEATAKEIVDAHQNALFGAATIGKERLPVSSMAVDAYRFKLPTGYVLEGDRYVFKPAEAAPAVPIQITIADFDTKGRLQAQATMPIQEAAQKIRARESMLQSLLNCLKGIKKS